MSADGHVTDPAPLMADFFANPANASLDWFGGAGGTSGGPLLLRDATGAPGSLTLADQAAAVFVAADDAGSGRAFRGGGAGGDGFSGWLCTESRLPDGATLALRLGHAAADGTDFQPAGPAGTITGDDGFPHVYTFALTGPTARIPAGRYLALEITNRTGAAVTIPTGLGWLGLSASLPPPSLPQLWLNLLD